MKISINLLIHHQKIDHVFILQHDVHNMVEFWEGFVQILLVLIPTLTAAFSSKFIIRSYQRKKEEFDFNKEKQALRKQILDDFENAYSSQLSILDNFTNLLIGEYTINYTIVSEKEKETAFTIELPEEEKEKPLKKFANEYRIFRSDINKNLRNIWKLFSTVRIYYELDDISDTMSEISGYSNYSEELVDVLMFSKTTKEFNDNYDKFLASFHEFRDLGHKLSHDLVTLDIRSPDVKIKKGFFKKIKEFFKKEEKQKNKQKEPLKPL